MSDASTPLHSQRAVEAKAERTAVIRTLAIYAAVVLVIYVVNSLSLASEIEWSRRPRPASLPWVQEGMAIIGMLVATPLTLWLGLRFPLERGRWRLHLLIHCAGALAYGLIQMNVMMTLRFSTWEAIYGFAYSYQGSALEMFIYEFRKQVPAYVGFLFLLGSSRGLEQLKLEAAAAQQDARTRHKVTLRCGGRVMRLPAEEFASARAAGNYVEARFGDGTHLARTTLADLERLLNQAGIDAVRVHRSWLVNRERVTEIAPTGEGDVSLTLSNGETVPGSRRYRERLAG